VKPPEVDPAKALETKEKEIADLRTKLETVTKESIERRHENTALKTIRDALVGAFPDLSQNAKDSEAVAAKVKAAQDLAQGEVKGILLHANAMSLAAKAGARDAQVVARLLDMSGIDADVSKRTVDVKVLSERVEAMKKDHAYLFTDGGGTPPPAGAPSPAPSRPPAGGNEGGTLGEQYDRLRAAGKIKEADELYLANRKAIGEHMEAKIAARRLT
jgi:hypothetical protein